MAVNFDSILSLHKFALFGKLLDFFGAKERTDFNFQVFD